MAKHISKQTPFRSMQTCHVPWQGQTRRQVTTSAGFARLQAAILDYHAATIEEWALNLSSAPFPLVLAQEIYDHWEQAFTDALDRHYVVGLPPSPADQVELLSLKYFAGIGAALVHRYTIAEQEAKRIGVGDLRCYLRDLFRGFYVYLAIHGAYQSGDSTTVREIIIAYTRDACKNLFLAAGSHGWSGTTGAISFDFLDSDAFASVVHERLLNDQSTRNEEFVKGFPFNGITPGYLVNLPCVVLNDAVRLGRTQKREITGNPTDYYEALQEAGYGEVELRALFALVKSDKQREYLILSVIDKMTDAEIATHWVCSRSNVSQRRERALATLERVYQPA